jgi:hypothetical protein
MPLNTRNYLILIQNKMKKLIINSINPLNNLIKNPIDFTPWADYKYKPIVHFTIAHNNKNILLHYTINEQSIRAKTLENNGNVWEDSCVECFIMPENDGIYYNFEFNCIGTKLLAVGNSRHNREFATANLLDKIIVKSSLNRYIFDEIKGDFNWEITIKIPIKCFFKHTIKTLKNKCFKANFYKCGDGLSTPHYLSWNNIETINPDFHTPPYFGEICFV